MAQVRMTSVLLLLLLFLAIIDVTLSLKEWKKFENGEVQSQDHEAAEQTKNKTEDDAVEKKQQQHILHSHHGEKLNRHKEKNDKKQPSKEDESSLDQIEPHRPNKDRHHRKNAEKMLHSGHRGEVNKQPTNTLPSQTGKLQQKKVKEAKDEKSSKDADGKKKSSNDKRSKPEGMSTIQWRRLQNEREKRKMERAKQIAESWLNRTEHQQSKNKLKKKYIIKKMDGNNKAKKLWNEVFRGPDRLVLK